MYGMARLANSFLLGWIVRTVTIRLAGSSAYRRLTVFMMGVIAGDVLGGLGNMLAGAIYYAATGQKPWQYLMMLR